MGASFVTHEFAAPDRAEAVRLAHGYQERCLYEYGHDAYSGHLGTCGIGVDAAKQEFESAAAAIEWIETNHNKWDVPVLARVKGTDRWVLAGWCPT